MKKKKRSYTELEKENRELHRYLHFVEYQVLHQFPQRIMTSIAQEVYVGKLHDRELWGAYRFMERYQEMLKRYMKRVDEFKEIKVLNKYYKEKYFSSYYGHSLNLTERREREEGEK